MTNNLKEKIRWVKSTDGLAVLTLFFAAPFFFIDLFARRFLLTERDLGPYFIPPRFFWVESLKQGDFPLWNPYQFCGHPFFANPQHAVLYPFNGLFFLLPFDVAFNAVIILHFFLGGLFTYLFLRDLKVDPSGALISGLVFMLSGYFLSVHSLLTILLSSVWTPLIMMFFRRALHRRGVINEMFTALSITLSFLGGGIEIVYGNIFVLLLMVFFTSSPDGTVLGSEPQHSRFIRSVPIYWGRVRSLLIISILFLFLSAIQLLPFIELFHHSIRGKGISYQEATIWSFSPKDILLFFLPDAYGYFLDMKKYWVTQCWFKTLYMGGPPFILSLIFFLLWRHVGEPLCGLHNRAATEGRPYKIYLFCNDRGLYLSLMLLSLFLSLGHYNPLYPFVFKYVPFFGGIRYPAKFLYIFILVVSITAGLGFHRIAALSKEGENRRYRNFFFIFSILCGFFLLFLVLGHKEIEHFLKVREIDSPQFNHLFVNLFHAKRFFFYFVLFFLMIGVGIGAKWKPWTRILLIFFLIADLFGNMGFYGKEKTVDYFQETKIIKKVSTDHGDFRIFSTGKTISLDTSVLIAGASPLDVLKEKHIPSLHLISRLHDIWGVDVIRLKRVDDLYKTFTGTPSISDNQLVELYGIRYIVSVTPLEGDPRFDLVDARLEGLQGEKGDLLKGNTIKLYQYRNAFPRAWVVEDFKVMDSKEILSVITQKGFNPGQEVLLEEEPEWKGASSPRGTGKNKVEIISEKNNCLRLQVETKKDSLLVLSDTYYPGWEVWVDGSPQKIYQANYAFRAVPLRAGSHQIKFVFDPVSFKWGAGMTLLGILGCIAGLRVGRKRERR